MIGTDFESLYDAALEQLEVEDRLDDDFSLGELSRIDRERVEQCLQAVVLTVAMQWIWDNGDMHQDVIDEIADKLKTHGPQAVVDSYMDAVRDKRSDRAHDIAQWNGRVDKAIARMQKHINSNNVQSLQHEVMLTELQFCDEDFEYILVTAGVPQFYAEADVL